MAKTIVVFDRSISTPSGLGFPVMRILCNNKGKNGVRRNGVVRKQGNSKLNPCGHAVRFSVAGKCIACEQYGPTLETQEAS